MINAKHLTLLMLLTCVSCNKGKIEDLEYEIEKLEHENKVLKSHIEELEKANSNYARQYEEYKYQQSDREQKLKRELSEREWHQRKAQQQIQSAEFWKENGNDFLYESSMRQAQQELDMIP